MHVILHTSDLQGFASLIFDDAREIRPNFALHLRRNPSLAVLGGKNDVVLKRKKRICHESVVTFGSIDIQTIVVTLRGT
jgi:hypothetical protein